MHGGAAGSGAPEGNENALKHGRYRRHYVEERRIMRALLRRSKDILDAPDEEKAEIALRPLLASRPDLKLK